MTFFQQYLGGVFRKFEIPMPPHKSHYFLDSMATTSYSLTTVCEVLLAGPFSDSVLTSKIHPKSKGVSSWNCYSSCGGNMPVDPFIFSQGFAWLLYWCRTLLFPQFQSPRHATLVIDTLPPPWKKSCPHQIILPCDTSNTYSGLTLSYLFNLSLFFHLLFALCLYQDSFFLLSHKYCGHTWLCWCYSYTC